MDDARAQKLLDLVIRVAFNEGALDMTEKWDLERWIKHKIALSETLHIEQVMLDQEKPHVGCGLCAQRVNDWVITRQNKTWCKPCAIKHSFCEDCGGFSIRPGLAAVHTPACTLPVLSEAVQADSR